MPGIPDCCEASKAPTPRLLTSVSSRPNATQSPGLRHPKAAAALTVEGWSRAGFMGESRMDSGPLSASCSAARDAKDGEEDDLPRVAMTSRPLDGVSVTASLHRRRRRWGRRSRGTATEPTWAVEQTYGILTLHRRPARDHEHRPSASRLPPPASRLYRAMTHVMTRRLTGANATVWRAGMAVAAWTSGPCSTPWTPGRLRPGPGPRPPRTDRRPADPVVGGRDAPGAPHTRHGLADRLPGRRAGPARAPGLPRILAAFNHATGPLRAKDVERPSATKCCRGTSKAPTPG